MNGDGSYVVWKVYEELNLKGNLVDAKFYAQIWKLPIPSKVKGFVWKVALNRIQSMENLKKKRIVTKDANLTCDLFNEEVQTTKQLLFEHKFYHDIWTQWYLW